MLEEQWQKGRAVGRKESHTEGWKEEWNDAEEILSPPALENFLSKEIKQGCVSCGVRALSFSTPTGNRFQDLDLLNNFIGANTFCKNCQQETINISMETDIERLSSSIIWECNLCGYSFLTPSSTKIKLLKQNGRNQKLQLIFLQLVE